MNTIKTMLENVFYSQDNRTITLSLENSVSQNDKDIYDTMEQIKNILKNIGVDNVSYSPDSAKMTIVTKEDKVDEIMKLAKDFKATVVHSGF